MVWFTIQREANTDIAVIHNVRVEAITADGWRVKEVVPPRVSIEVRGDREAVTAITSDHFLARIEMGSLTAAGETDMTLTETSIASPTNIRVLKVEPARVRVRIEQMRQP